jgi:hypothetical protein
MILPIMGLIMIQVFCTSEVMTDLISLEQWKVWTKLNQWGPRVQLTLAEMDIRGRLDEP